MEKSLSLWSAIAVHACVVTWFTVQAGVLWHVLPLLLRYDPSAEEAEDDTEKDPEKDTDKGADKYTDKGADKQAEEGRPKASKAQERANKTAATSNHHAVLAARALGAVSGQRKPGEIV